MKSVVKLVKSLHADSATISAMFLGYFVLLTVSTIMIFKSAGLSHEKNTVATSQVKSENVSRN